MQDGVYELLEKRMKKSMGRILGVKERVADPHLPPDAADLLRKTVLREFNDFLELCVDVMESVDDGSVTLNQVYLDKLDELYETLVGAPAV